MKKTIVLFLSCIGFLSASFSAAHAVGLKENSMLSDNMIKLGDIFYDLPRNENRVLGAAPRPGQEMVLDARTLLRIALALDLPWRPSSNMDHIVLRRDATVIPLEDIQNALQNAISDQGIYGEYEISVPEHQKEIILPSGEPATLDVTDMNINSRKKTFTAVLAAPSSENPIQNFRIQGRIDPVIKVPALVENIENGRMIRPRDITMVKIKEIDFSQDTIADAQSLIGMTARRILIAGRPIRETEIVAPQVVSRGEFITLSLNTGIMNITTQVKSLENGAKGDVIRVLNTTSNQTLQAMVTGENAVTIIKN